MVEVREGQQRPKTPCHANYGERNSVSTKWVDKNASRKKKLRIVQEKGKSGLSTWGGGASGRWDIIERGVKGVGCQLGLIKVRGFERNEKIGKERGKTFQGGNHGIVRLRKKLPKREGTGGLAFNKERQSRVEEGRFG